MGMLKNAIESIGARYGQDRAELDNALYLSDQALEPLGYDLGTYTPIDPVDPVDPVDPPVDPVDPPVDPVDPPVDPVDPPVDPVDPVTDANPVVTQVRELLQTASNTGDYTGINQYLDDYQISLFGLKQLFAGEPEETFQGYLDAGVVPFGYTPPDTSPTEIPEIGDITGDLPDGISELISGLVDSLNAKAEDYNFGGGYGGSFEPEVYDPGLDFAGYRTPGATGINVSNPFGQYTLSEAESEKSAVAPVDLPSFSRDQFARTDPAQRDSLIRDAVANAGLGSPSIADAMIKFGVTPDQLSSAIGLPVAGLPQGLQSITPDQFETRTIPGTTPATFIPQVGDITPLSGVSTGLPSLGVQPLPTYNPISFAATPEQVAAATIGAMNAAEAEQS